MTDYDDAMASAMTPIVGKYWDTSGRQTYARLGLDQDNWQVHSPYLHDKIRTASLNFCQSTNETTDKRLDVALDMLRTSLAQGLIEQGEAVPQLTQRVKDIFEGMSTWKAQQIAVTEASRAVHAAQLEADIQSDVVAGVELLLSSDACDLCRKVATEAKTVRLGQAFAQIGHNPDYSSIKHPPIHVNCCLPETPVIAPLGVTGIEAQYDGPVVRLHLLGGSHITVTPNHMLMTPQGFARAMSLMPGDDLLRYSVAEPPTGSGPNDHGNPPTIKQVFDSWSIPDFVALRSMPMTSEHLHGDAAFCQSDINVVPANGFLWDYFHPQCFKPGGQSPLISADHRWSMLSGYSDLAAMLFALRDATDGGVGALREQQSLLRRHSLEPVGLAVGAIAGSDSGFNESTVYSSATDSERKADCENGFSITEPSDDFIGIHQAGPANPSSFGSSASLDPSGSEPGPDGRKRHSDRLSECLERLASKVTTCQIIDIERFHYKGPVYDLQTLTSLYLIGDGIVSSNCQCAMIEVLKPEFGGPEHVSYAETLHQPQSDLGDTYTPPPGKKVPKPEPEKAKEPVKAEPEFKPELNPEEKVEPLPAPAKTPPAPEVDHSAETLKAATARIAAHGIPVLGDAKAEIIKLYGEETAKHIPAIFVPNKDVPFIAFNPQQAYWKDPEAWMKTIKPGWLSTGDKDHPTTHEIGHALHHREVGHDEFVKLFDWQFSKDDRALIEKHVSKYATGNATEFVAEVFTGRQAGKSYPENIMLMYHELGGPG